MPWSRLDRQLPFDQSQPLPQTDELQPLTVDGLDEIEAARRLRPDLIIMDLRMPGMSGMDAAREIRREFQNLSIMLMTEPDPEIMAAARRLGIRGTVSKVGSILSGVRAVLRGAEFF